VGTSVFAPVAQFTTGSYPRPVVTNFPVDFAILGDRSSSWGYNLTAQDRLRGGTRALFTSDTVAENTGALSSFASNTQFGDGWVSGSTNAIYECFQRAPSFFDEVCFNGSDTDFTVNHNLQAIPELIILKKRNGTGSWFVGGSIVGFNSANNNNNLFLNNTNAIGTSTLYTATWTSSAMYMSGGVNFVAGTTAVAYLFATCAGVSKVFSFTGTGSLQTINCGFTSGARFVLIKRTDAAGDWYVWDSARGISSSTDPYLLLNSTAAEVTSTNWVDTTSTGFQVTAASGNNVNINGATYIGLAIA